MRIATKTTPKELSQAIKERLHPEPYARDIQPCGSFDFLIMRASALPGGRYAFAFRRLGNHSVRGTYKQSRTEARSLTGAVWLFREVGLYLMLCGPRSLWEDHTTQAPVDRSGFHNIIVQATHFVDPETGDEHLNQSSWGPFKFGGLIPIPEMVKGLIQNPKFYGCG